MGALSVKIQMVDNLSARLAAVANAGQNLILGFEKIEDAANSAYSAMEASVSAAGSAFGQASDASDDLAFSMNGYEQNVRFAAQAANSLADEVNAGYEALTAGVDIAEEAAGGLSEFSDQAEEAGNSSQEFGKKSSSAMNELNSLLVSGGIAAALHEVAEGFAECATNAEIVETSVAQLQTIAGGGAIGALSEELMELSNDTGQAAEGLADTVYNAISAGTAAEESVDAAAQANQLAVAGFTDTTSALSVLETAINSYGEAAGGMEHVSDSLITVQNLGVTTVRELAAQMGKAISTASAYNVSLENLESGYISVTKAGINTAEGTTYLSSMLNELGNSGSAISKLLKEETGSTFGELMNEGKSLADVLGLVYDACDNNAEAMMNMWGSAEAGKAANAIIGQGLDTFNDNLTTLREGAGTTAEAYSIMAGTTEYAHNKMDNAAKNLSVQIGEVLNPTLSKLYAGMEAIYTGIGNIVTEHPVVVKAIAAVTVGVAAFAGGIAAYTAATTIATAVQTAFNGAMLANPVFWLVGGIAALSAGIVFLASTYEDATDSTNDLTYASEEQGKELEKLRKEYDEVCESEGAGTQRASELASRIYELEQAYGESGETVGQFRERIDELGKSLDEIHKTYRDNVESADDMYGSANILIGELQVLQHQASLTDTELQVMKSIVGELNGTYEDLGLTINEKTGKLNYSMEDLFDYVKAQKQQQEIEAASKGLAKALGKYDETKETYKNATQEAAISKEKYEETRSNWGINHPVLMEVFGTGARDMSSDVGNALDHMRQTEEASQKASAEMTNLKKDIEEYCKTLGYSDAEIEKFISSLEDGSIEAEKSAVKFGESGEELVSYEDAVTGAVNSSQVELEELAKAYDDAYEAALDSIEGQYSLWDKIDKKVLNAKTSVDKIGSALDSQIEYWKDYSKNLGNLQGRDVKGLDDVLKNMDDGSEESAAALAGMAKASNKELEKIVQKYEKLQKAQGKTADKVADLESDFASKCKEMSDDLKESVEKMNMEHDAEAAAKKTIQAYIKAIRSGVGGAKSAADAVADATAKALKTPNQKAVKPPSVPQKKFPELPDLLTKTIQANAKGTTDSDTVYVAGEEGPELILSGGGDTVFPKSETDRIISAVSEENDNRQITEPSLMSRPVTMKSESYDEPAGSDRTVTIRLEGGGTVLVGPGSSKEEIWNGTKGKIKSAFMQILKEEVFEEGAGAYEF